jgi:taurine dioxygenase
MDRYSGSHMDELTGLAVPKGITLDHQQPTIGTIVGGVDLRRPLDAESIEFLKSLWLKRRVIFFHDQLLSEDQHIRLGRYFGTLEVVPPAANLPPAKYPEVLIIDRNGSDSSGNEAFFHQDVPYSNPPIAGAIALLRKCPPLGGDTVFADMIAAYEGLPPWLKRAVAGLKAEHRFDEGIRYYNRSVTQEHIDRLMAKFPARIHPVVQTHPETGAKILYVSLPYTSRIMDLPRDESYALIKLLSDQARVPEYQCRFRWHENSVAIWDNRAVQHYACFDYPDHQRSLHRVTVLSANPWPADNITTPAVR